MGFLIEGSNSRQKVIPPFFSGIAVWRLARVSVCGVFI